MASSRWQDFRQRPYGQRIRWLAFAAAVSMLYLYCLFGTQSHMTNELVAKRNVEKAKKEWIKVYERKHLSRSKRQKLLRSLKNETGQEGEVVGSERGGQDEQSQALEGRGLFVRAVRLIKNIVGAVGLLVLARMMTTTRNGWRRRSRRNQTTRNRRFRHWVSRLNRQREAQGERPISPDVLRLVLRDREPNGDDYDGLLQFQEQAGPAMLLQNMGATGQEIARCPTRTLQDETDDLLVPTKVERKLPSCAICLETYQVGETVRTIPCFHSFHTQCIDPWLAQKAVCPICKHSAIT